MSETLHNRPVPHAKLGAALKRNIARRKAGGQGSGVSNEVGAGGATGVTSPEGEVEIALEEFRVRALSGEGKIHSGNGEAR